MSVGALTSRHSGADLLAALPTTPANLAGLGLESVFCVGRFVLSLLIVLYTPESVVCTDSQHPIVSAESGDGSPAVAGAFE